MRVINPQNPPVSLNPNIYSTNSTTSPISQYLQILIERADARVIPGLRSMIEVVDAATPLTNMRYTKNPEGAIVGYEWSMNNSFMNRIKNRTPIKGLYLTSAWGNIGGGYLPLMVGAQITFKALMEDWEKKT